MCCSYIYILKPILYSNIVLVIFTSRRLSCYIVHQYGIYNRMNLKCVLCVWEYRLFWWFLKLLLSIALVHLNVMKKWNWKNSIFNESIKIDLKCFDLNYTIAWSGSFWENETKELSGIIMSVTGCRWWWNNDVINTK